VTNIQVQKLFPCSLFIYFWASLKIPCLHSVFESCVSPAYTPSWLSFLLPHLQSLVQEVALEVAQLTKPWPQPVSASAAAVTQAKHYRGLKKFIRSFVLTCRVKPHITDESSNRSDMKKYMVRAILSTSEQWCFSNNYNSHPSSTRHVS